MASASLVAFAGKSVAGPIINLMVTKGFKYLNGYFSTKSMEKMESELKERMPQIQAVLDVVSPDHIMNNNDSEALDQWFWQLRDAVEAAEDAIDELEYYELEQKADDEKVSDWGSSFAKMKHKAVKSVKHVSILDKTLGKFTHRGTREKLKKAMEGLNKVAAGTTKFLKVIERRKGAASGSRQQEDSTNNDRQTGSTETVTKFVGRTIEKKRILEWLTKKTTIEEAETNYIPVLSIVGHGGMGKTTLAQSICKQDKVVKDFKIIWVTVSTSFDATSVTSKILECATGTKPSANHLEPLQQDLKQKLKYINFLLVLDDVWEDKKRDEWEKLFAPLRKVKTGSKILLTTRMRSVADMAANVMGVERDQYLTLGGLEVDENLKLFNHHVFSGKPQDYLHLALIGEHIAKKLGGCPLVTKVVSGHLQGNMTFEYWNRFLHEDLEHFKRTEEDIMEVLRLSYNNLPTQSQVCFRYCSIFPQDYEFAKKELLQMWMGSGLISQATKPSETLEDIGERCLAQLTRKSFFDLKSRDLFDDDGKYVMHDLMHELATYVSSGECARIIYPARFEDVKDTVRHLSVSSIACYSTLEVKEISRFKNLRTIIIGQDLEPTISEDMARMIANVVENSKALRLLQIRNLKVEHFPDIFANWKHLRYIKFPGMSKGASAEGILKLYHLMVLLDPDTDGILIDRREQKVEKRKLRQEKQFGCLDRLRYVSYGRGAFGEFPIGKLTSLQELNRYRVQGKKGNEISALGNLKSLRKLQVQGLENVEKPEEAGNARLHEKRYLTSLSLEWSVNRTNEESRADDYKVLHHLNLHDNVRELQISGYGGQSLPLWIESLSVKNLASIQLRRCINLARLPSLEGLLLLNHIELENLPRLQQIGQSSDASSSGCIGSSLPAAVHTLIVTDCGELRELPILSPSLVHLKIVRVGLTRLPRISKLCSGSGQTESCQLLHIRLAHCPSLTSLDGSFVMQKQYMGTLRDLDIRDCEHLECTALPFEEMIELRKLFVSNCPKLDARDKLLPLSLEELTINAIPGHSEPPLLGSLLGLSNLSHLGLFRCSGLVSLPTTDVFKSLHSLKSVSIISCENLSSLGGLGSLASLEWLDIIGCTKLPTVGSSPTPHASGGEEAHLWVPSSLQISMLTIDRPSLLLAEPLKSLRHTKGLVIRDASTMESLPMRWLQQNRASLRSLEIFSAISLRSLPPSLEELTLHDVNSLTSLPDLPSSLRLLYIWPGDSSELKLVFQESCISHIPRVEIGRSRFTMGKLCSEETFYSGLRPAGPKHGGMVALMRCAAFSSSLRLAVRLARKKKSPHCMAGSEGSGGPSLDCGGGRGRVGRRPQHGGGEGEEGGGCRGGGEEGGGDRDVEGRDRGGGAATGGWTATATAACFEWMWELKLLLSMDVATLVVRLVIMAAPPSMCTGSGILCGTQLLLCPSSSDG